MITCPDCGQTNLPGAESCEQCQQPLNMLAGLKPRSLSERIVATDTIQLLAPKRPIFVAPDDPVREVLQTLVARRVGCVLIAQGRELLGIFSERDALMRIGTQAAALAAAPISQFMTPRPTTLEAHDTIAFALHQMDLGGFRHIPITTDGTVTGVISVRDILRYVTRRLAA